EYPFQRMPLVVGMHSEDFDSVLYLTDSKFNFLTSDDNSGQGFDARITETLDAGDYVVIAFARDGATGGYTLTTGDAGTPPDPNGTVFLLLHGLNSDPGTWDRFVEDVMGGDCPILTDDIIQSDGAPVSRCYRYAFGASNSEGFEWQHGDGLTYTELGANVGSAVEYIRRIANPLNLILVGHSRGGLAARAYLQTLTPPLPIRFGLLTIGTPHQGSPFGRIGVWLKDHDYTPDNQDFGHDQLYFMYSPSTRYLATASDSSGEPVRNSASQPIWDLNDGVGNLNGVVSVYGQITSGGLELGTYPGLGNVLFASALLPGSRDQMLDFVLQNLSTDWRDNGDGIVPSASQRFVNIPGFELTADLWYLDLNNHVFHTQETDYSFDILRILNRMRSSLPPAPPSDAAADKAPPRASAGQHDDQPQSVFPLEQAYLRGEAHLLINAAKDPGYDSGEYTAAVLRLLAAEHEQPARRALFHALALNGSSGATEAIFRLAAFSADARALALEALAAIDRGGAVDALLNHAQNDPDPGLRVAAIHTLGRLHTGGASEALLRLALAATGEQDPAVEALADLPSLKSVNAVKKAVAEFPFRSESVRQRLRTMVEQRERDSTALLERVGR
ncbi:MAG: HEAT repeat domain-containing protein, partial [Acidobacteria bacterium]|nr:HEAT repeat domain-containing protein [Acidobacteriota bacterium]